MRHTLQRGEGPTEDPLVGDECRPTLAVEHQVRADFHVMPLPRMPVRRLGYSIHMAATLRALNPPDAAALYRLRREALLETPDAFLASPEDDIASSPEAIAPLLARAPESVVFGAFDPKLVGFIGFYRDTHVKAAHKAHIWGTYVRAASRGKGLGAQLLQTALAHARGLDGITTAYLAVSETASAARALYERAGFTVWAFDPYALSIGGKMIGDHHMLLSLT